MPGPTDIITLDDVTAPAPFSAEAVVAELVETEWEQLDRIEQLMAEMPPIDCPLVHRFTPGLYIREIFMPAGALITSKIHRTTHPFVISKGRAKVWTQETGWVELTAPHGGITQPGTRRLLYIVEDTVWTTVHRTDLTDIDAIEREIIEPRTAHLEGINGAERHAIASLFQRELAQ